MTFAAPLVLGITAMLSQEASAIPIIGEISFAGSYTINNPDLSVATAFTGFTGVTVSAAPTGDYSGLAGTGVTQNAFSFDPFPGGGVVPLWSLVAQPGTTFDLLALNIAFESPTSLLLTGTGIAHKTGRDNTPGTWVLSANTLGTTFSFSSTNSSVPDGGTTVALLGMALVGVEGLRRKLGSAKL